MRVYILMRGTRPWGVFNTGKAAELERARLCTEGAAVKYDFEIIAMDVES